MAVEGVGVAVMEGVVPETAPVPDMATETVDVGLLRVVVAVELESMAISGGGAEL